MCRSSVVIGAHQVGANRSNVSKRAVFALVRDGFAQSFPQLL
jgi:hypothetical protein